MKQAILINLDEALADSTHRKNHLEGRLKDWNQYFEQAQRDHINPWCRALLYSVNSNNMTVFLYTCRPEVYRDSTVKWLQSNKIYPFSYKLCMKPKECSSFQQEDVKKAVYGTLKEEFKIMFAVDSETKSWTDLGLVSLKVEENEKPPAGKKHG